MENNFLLLNIIYKEEIIIIIIMKILINIYNLKFNNSNIYNDLYIHLLILVFFFTNFFFIHIY